MSHLFIRFTKLTVMAVCATLTSLAAAASTMPLPEIKAENARWIDAYAKSDFGTIGSLYTEDAALLPPGEGRIVGPFAISRYFREKAGTGGPRTISFLNLEFYGDDSTVVEITDTEIRDQHGQLLSLGKQMLIFVKVAGVWKLHRDIWNANPTSNSKR